MTAQRYFLKLAYKGTRYFGWQIQPNQISIQQEIERALTQLNSNEKIEITGCGRTDTGVHASMYFAHFDTYKKMDPQHLSYKLNLMLPQDIAILEVFEVNADTHARFSATSRSYEYKIHTAKNPFIAETSWFYNVDLDLAKIKEACALLSTHSDFECFSKVHTDVSNFNCTIHYIDWLQTEHGYLFQISANRFLRNMVRAIVGTLLDVGTGKITIEELNEILASKNRSKAGISVPAHGLTLTKITYPASLFP